MKRILVIDGNYFAMRVLGQLNMKDSVNNLESNIEKNNFTSALNASLINLYTTFNNDSKHLIDNVIFCTDNKSWRKEIPAHRPYYIAEESDKLIEYKEQRKEVKEKSTINYDNFYFLYNNFVQSIKDKLVVFDIEGLEGDDEIMLLSNKLAGNKNVELLVFCTDGDLNQVVKDNCMLFRNIRSKDVPNGEFVISLKKYGQIFENKNANPFLSNNTDNLDYKKLFSIAIGNTNDNFKIERTLHKGINIATPFLVALEKSICGDKKDNIFSLMSWKSTTGTKDFKITEAHLEKALKVHGYYLTEENCQKILSDKEALINLLLALQSITKQKDIKIDLIGKHLKHNLRMIVLSRSNIPEKYLDAFDIHWLKNEERILEGDVDFSKLKKFNVNMKDSAIEVFENSLPDMNEILK